MSQVKSIDMALAKSKLAEKMNEELSNQHPYEAMMYVQTFVARKRKVLSKQDTCDLVYCGIKTLQSHSEWMSAGVLLEWLVSTGSLELNPQNSNFDNITAIITAMPKDGVISFLDKAYKPLCAYIQTYDGDIKHRYMFQLSLICGEIFEKCRRWRDAKNCYIGVGDMVALSRVVHQWTTDGFPSEYSLYFVRTYLFVLANRLVPQAAAFYRTASDQYLEPYELTLSCQPDTPLRKACMKSYALWQMCTILSDMMNIADNPTLAWKVDRKQVFSLVMDKYRTLIECHDAALLPVMRDIGHGLFGVPEDTSAGSGVSPLQSIFQNLMGGSGGVGKPTPTIREK